MILRAAALALMLAAPAAADTAETARAAATALQRAIAGLEAARAGRDQVAALTAAIGAYETGLGALREALRQATIREAALTMRLAAERERVARLLGVLSGLDQDPGPLLLLHPAGPLGMARSGMMLAEVTPALQAEVAALRAQLAEVTALRAAQAEATAALGTGLDAAQAARAALSRAIAGRTDLPRRLIDDPAMLAALAANVATLDAMASALDPAPDADGPDFEALRGALPLPVRGRVIRRPGEADMAGIVRPGLVLATRPEALVTAPTAGTIRYRGPLGDYGIVILLEPAPGYLLVMAGMGAVFGEVGEIVGPGAPLGLMGGREALAPREGAGAAETETLYIELRRDAGTIDPAPWFAETKG